ncbi:MAG TPA: hypothetical protein DCE42_13920 [Myxococcales bacterium]|nr:hypothetical protein [Deltaproteobacteria bacterium]MBU50966.1 hypothetical protein [Deltaproteobacteria bacterium]HAA55855.1 hypothetical protein [Myxococcales bacterium]
MKRFRSLNQWLWLLGFLLLVAQTATHDDLHCDGDHEPTCVACVLDAHQAPALSTCVSLPLEWSPTWDTLSVSQHRPQPQISLLHLAPSHSPPSL